TCVLKLGLACRSSPAGCGLDLEHRNDMVVAIHDDDLVIVDEVEVSTPIRVVLDQHRRDLNDPNRCRYDGANRDVEVDARHPRCTATAQDGLAHLGLLLDG